jgi:hypothetical protein
MNESVVLVRLTFGHIRFRSNGISSSADLAPTYLPGFTIKLLSNGPLIERHFGSIASCLIIRLITLLSPGIMRLAPKFMHWPLDDVATPFSLTLT